MSRDAVNVKVAHLGLLRAATRVAIIAGRKVIAIDGKSLRGARTNQQSAPHLVAALLHGIGAVIGQLQTPDKSNEIPAVRALLGTLDLAGAVVTMDALHTLDQTLAQIAAAGADYVVCVKANQKSLHRGLKALPWSRVPGHTRTETGHGRRATRTIKVTDVPAWLDFAGAEQVAQLRRTVTKNKKRTVEVVPARPVRVRPDQHRPQHHHRHHRMGPQHTRPRPPASGHARLPLHRTGPHPRRTHPARGTRPSGPRTTRPGRPGQPGRPHHPTTRQPTPRPGRCTRTRTPPRPPMPAPTPAARHTAYAVDGKTSAEPAPARAADRPR